VGIQHQARANETPQFQEVLNGIPQVIQHTDMIGNIHRETIGLAVWVFNIPFEHLGMNIIERTSNDGFHDVLDAGINGSDLASKPAKSDGVNTLEAANLQDMLVGQIKAPAQQYDSSVRDILGFTAFARPGCIPESPAPAIDGKAVPLQQAIQFRQVSVT
jgi:hypothetical protein